MKKIQIISFFLILALGAFGQQRNAKDIEKMFKGLDDITAIMNGASFQDGNVSKTLFLTNDTKDLNEIERRLVSEYAQVAVMCNMKGVPFQCYFVKDSEGKRGLVGLNGEVIVPPLTGNICNIPVGKDFGILLVGEMSRPSCAQLLQDWGRLILSKENDMLGLFSAIVVNADSPKISNLLPVGDYIYLSLGSRGNGKFDIFTLKAVGDDALWGIVDVKGKEILPNKYTGFTRKSHLLDINDSGLWGKWVGTTEMDMSEALQYSNDLKADIQRRRQELGQALNSFGEGMMDAAQTVQTIQNTAHGDSSDAGDGSAKGGKSSGAKNDMSEHQSYNTDKSTYSNYDSMLSQVFAGNRQASVSEIKDWQSKMKSLRKKWEAKGKSFPHSANEDR